jgi:single-stranded-DNA-specific exonuclease
MLAETEEEASVFAAQLEGHNKDRQKLTKSMLEEAESQAVDPTSPLLVFWNEAWSPALVGLVAGKFMDRYGKPVIAIGKHGNNWIGSGRSFTGYDITAAVKRAGEGILTRSGGHVQACGFSFEDSSQLQTLVDRLVADARTSLNVADCIPGLPIEAELGLSDITWQLVDTISRFEPYGEGNRKPIFVSRKLKVISSDLMGQTKKHVRAVLGSTDGNAMKFVGFNFSDRFELFTPGNWVDVAFDIGINDWMGRKEIQCKLVDVLLATQVS